MRLAKIGVGFLNLVVLVNVVWLLVNWRAPYLLGLTNLIAVAPELPK